MRLTFALLADAATADAHGRLTIVGAGLETVWASTFPCRYRQLVLLARFELSPAECGYDHPLRIPFLGPDGEEIATIEGSLHGERSRAEPYRAVVAPVLVTMADLPFPTAGDYAFHLLVDGFEVATLPLSARCIPATPATASTTVQPVEEHGPREQ